MSFLDFPLLSFSFLIFSFVSFRRRSRIAARCSRRSSNSSSLLFPSPPPRFLIRIASIFACNLARRFSMLSDCGSGTIGVRSSSGSVLFIWISNSEDIASPSESSDVGALCFPFPLLVEMCWSPCRSSTDLLFAGLSYNAKPIGRCHQYTSRETSLFSAGLFRRLFYRLFWCLLLFLILVVSRGTLQELHK